MQQKRIIKLKNGEMHETVHKLHFVSSSSQHFKYNLNLKDNILDWGNRNLRPDSETLSRIKSICPVSRSYYNFRTTTAYPVQCEFKDGTTSDYGVIVFRNHPPTEHEFEHPQRWRYFDEIQNIKASPKVVSNELALRMTRMKEQGINSIYVTDKQNNSFVFYEPTTWLYDRYCKYNQWRYYLLNSNDLTIIDRPTENKFIQPLSFDFEEYERKEFVPPAEIVTVFADI